LLCATIDKIPCWAKMHIALPFFVNEKTRPPNHERGRVVVSNQRFVVLGFLAFAALPLIGTTLLSLFSSAMSRSGTMARWVSLVSCQQCCLFGKSQAT
jgi:hypothetical protein